MTASITNRVNATTACFPGASWQSACQQVSDGVHEPLWGILGARHVQLCPQNAGRISERVLDDCQTILPWSQLRLHASVKLNAMPHHEIVDASSDSPYADFYLHEVANLSARLKSDVYSLHAGYRSQSTLDQMRERVLRWQDEHRIRIAVEGLYPDERRPRQWLVDSWIEYEWLWTSGLYYAIDLSHLNIVAERERFMFPALVEAMCVSPYCLEVHVSDNDGKRDSHGVPTEEPWWMAPLERAMKGGMTAVIFSESNQKKGVQQ